MATPQEISFITSNCLMELRPRIKDLPKEMAIPLIDAACLRYQLPFNHIAPLLGFDLRDEPVTEVKKKERKKITFAKKSETNSKIKKPSISSLFADNAERIRFYGMLHYLKSRGIGLHDEFISVAKENRYQWIKLHKDTVLNYSLKPKA